MRLFVVSNRMNTPNTGHVSAGGMTVGIAGALATHGGIWLGWSGYFSRCDSVTRHQRQIGNVCHVGLDLPRHDYERYYSGFANQVWWPLAHDRPDLVRYTIGDAAAFRRISARFADALLSMTQPTDVIWVHDYHLIPLARALRERGWKGPVGLFLHTPFPQAGALAKLPVAQSMARDFAAFTRIGLQTRADEDRFHLFMAQFCDDSEGAGARPGIAEIATPGTQVAPVGIDTAAFARAATLRRNMDPRLAKAFTRLGDRKAIIAVDRLDYSKGIAERVCVYETLQRLHPACAAKAGLIQVAPTGRKTIPAYRAEEERVRAAHEAIVSAYGPEASVLLTEAIDRDSLALAYRRARVALVTPLRDGMNLVAKEYVAAQDPQDPGVLVLSREAGAAAELGAGALIVDPHDLTGMATALATALTMDIDERRRRWRAMMAVLWRHDAARWADMCLTPLYAAVTKARDVETVTQPEIARRIPFRFPADTLQPKSLAALTQHRTADQRFLPPRQFFVKELRAHSSSRQ
jgi:trehalose 6-phosphate synthase